MPSGLPGAAGAAAAGRRERENYGTVPVLLPARRGFVPDAAGRLAQQAPAMLAPIIAGVDGHAGGDDALAFAEALGGQVLPVGIPPERSSNAGPPGPGRTGRAGTIGRSLHVVAEGTGARLIVIGASRKGRVGRLVLGADARATLHDPPCPVAVVPRGWRDGSRALDRIGVGWDGPTQADAAFALARRLAEGTGARVGAAGPFGGMSPPGADPAAEAFARRAANADLLVMGSRCGRSVLHATGQTTCEALASLVACPVLLVPPALCHEGAAQASPALAAA